MSAMPPAEDIAAKLGRAQRDGNSWRCDCPVCGAHAFLISDRSGQTLWHCFGSDCGQAAMTEALRKLGAIPKAAAKSNGNGERHPRALNGCAPIREHFYADEAGGVVFCKCRYPLSGADKFRPWTKINGEWRMGGKPPAPYRLGDLRTSTANTCLFAEGERDADSLHSLGYTATSHKGWYQKWNKYVARFGTLVAFGDLDASGTGDDQVNKFDPGRDVLRFSTAEVANLLGVGGKDISELHAAVGGENLRAAIDQLVSPDDPAPAVDDAPTDDPAPLHLPDSFWQSRPWLQQFRAWAHGRGYPADASLAVVLTRAAAMLPTTAVLDTGILSRRHPNLFACIVGHPGVGKTQALVAGSEFIRPPDGIAFIESSPGSGEGIEGAMCEYSKETGWRQIRWNVWFFMDEGKALESLSQRSGSTLAEKMRSAWSGVPLSSALANGIRCAKDYAVGLAVCSQPTALAGLMSEADLGGPARFVFAMSNDPTRPRNSPSAAMPATSDWRPYSALTLSPDVRAIIEEDYYRASTSDDERDALNAHRNLLRARLAVILAGLTECRDEANVDDWGLAGMMMDISDNVRAKVLIEVEAAKQEAKSERVALHAAMVHAGKAALDGPNPIPRIAATLARKCRKLGRMKPRDIHWAIKSSDRIYRDAALAHAADLEWIERDGDGWKPGKSQPAV